MTTQPAAAATAAQGNPIYHPTLVGDDFFLQSGAAVSINLAPPTER